MTGDSIQSFCERTPGPFLATAPEMELLHWKLTERIIGIYHDVYTELGNGFLESVCQKAMIIALRADGLSVLERVPFPVFFRGQLLGNFIADLVVDDKVLLEIKSKSAIHSYD